MRNRHILIVLLGAFVLSAMAGCAVAPKYRPELPEKLVGDSGLVVGQVVGVNRLSSWSKRGDVLINDKKRGKIVNGFIAIPMSPGEYNLSGLYSETYSGSGTYTYKHMTTLPLKRSFTVRPKAVTNLGLIVLYPDPTDKEQKKFLRLFVDNTTDMKHFLKTSYPVLAAELRSDAMTLAPGELLPDNLLELLRKDLAMQEAVKWRGIPDYVADDVGTLAEVQKNKEGKITGVKLIETGTVSNLKSQSPNFVKDRFAFLTTNNRLFLVKNGKVSEKRVPADLRDGKVFVSGTSDMVIIDDKFEIYTSTNNGDSWQAYAQAATEKTVEVKLAAGKSGHYAYMVAPPAMLYSDHGRASYRPVALPEGVKNLDLVREKPIGLFAEGAARYWGEKEKRPFYFMPSGKTAWEVRSMPALNCGILYFQDENGSNIETACEKVTYKSGDGGKTWQKKN